jgi:hypothetical protein
MNRLFTALALATFLAAPVLHADTLLIKRSQQAHGAAFPKRGSSKAQVSAAYGAPSTKHAAVGKPPITRWDYPAFSVYFEYDHVIDAVVKQASENEIGVKPSQQSESN